MLIGATCRALAARCFVRKWRDGPQELPRFPSQSVLSCQHLNQGRLHLSPINRENAHQQNLDLRWLNLQNLRSHGVWEKIPLAAHSRQTTSLRLLTLPLRPFLSVFLLLLEIRARRAGPTVMSGADVFQPYIEAIVRQVRRCQHPRAKCKLLLGESSSPCSKVLQDKTHCPADIECVVSMNAEFFEQ